MLSCHVGSQDLMGSGSNDSSAPKPNAQDSLVVLRSPLPPPCSKGWPLLGAWPMASSSPHPTQFPRGLRSSKLGHSTVSGGLTARVLGHPLGARKNLNTLVKPNLKATLPQGCWLIPPFQSSSLSPIGRGSRCFCPADINVSRRFRTAPPFPLGELPTLSRPVVQGWECNPVWPIRVLTCPALRLAQGGT